MSSSITYLTIPEEIFLLTLYDKEGDASILQKKTFDVILSGAILMDLALRNCIDSDLSSIYLDKIEPTNDFVLDEVLSEISAYPEHNSIDYWLSRVALKAEKFRDLIIASLLRKGIIKVEGKKLKWFSKTPKYPLLENKEVMEIKTRVLSILASDTIPDIRDIVIISLIENSGLLKLILSDAEIKNNQERIKQIAQMDLIGQAIATSLKISIAKKIESKLKDLVGLNSKSPEEKLEEMINEVKSRFNIDTDDQLPAWLRMGTEQYKKTLEFVEETGTANIAFNPYLDKYQVKNYSAIMHVFGSGY